MLASPAEDAARDPDPARPRGLGGGQVRRDPGPAPQARDGRPALLARPPRHRRPVPGDRGGRPAAAPGTASSTARSWPGRTGSSCRSSRSRAGSAASRRRPRSRRTCRSSTSPSMRLALGRRGRTAADRSSRSCAWTCARAAPGWTRWTCRSAGEGGRFIRSHLAVAADTDALEAAFLEARARRNEGLMVKDPTSGYSPGRRGLGWLKMKKALATIDCVVVGVEVGHGKRHGVLSDYTFAVRDTETDRLVTIGKAYSGLTDAEIAEMTRWFEAHTIARYGRYRQVEPLDRRRDRVRRHRPVEPPQVRLLAALPADRQPAAGQVARRDRHRRDGDRAVRGAPARDGAARDRDQARGRRRRRGDRGLTPA